MTGTAGPNCLAEVSECKLAAYTNSGPHPQQTIYGSCFGSPEYCTIVEKTFVTTFRAEVPDAGEFEGTPEITPQPGLFAQPEVRVVMFGLGLKGKV